MKVILTCLPYFNHFYTPPIQLAYLKSYLQQDKDLVVKALDLEVFLYRSGLMHSNLMLYWENICKTNHLCDDSSRPMLDQAVNRILSEEPDVVGFSVAHSNFYFTRYAAQRIKEINPNIYIIYGGRYFCFREPWRYWVSELHKDFYEADCIIKNEGEASLMEIVVSLKKGIKPVFCQGATVRKDNDIVDGGDRNLIRNIDTIPFPDFSDFPKKDYMEDYIRILFSRGCVGQCVYCVENDTMGSVRYRSARNIVDELKLRVYQGYKKFQICDLALNSRLDNLLEVCNLIIKENIDMEFTFSEFRNTPGLTPEVFHLLYKSGFRTACFGTESGSQKILNRMNKGVKIETIEKNLRDAHHEGLKVILYLMVGFPGETEETFLETIEMLKRNKDFVDGIVAIASTEICAGSHIHDHLNRYNLNAATLFKYPDVWESKDGKNCLEWRKGLRDRMIQCLKDFKIPLADFVSDGNPRISLNCSRVLNAERIEEYKRKISPLTTKGSSVLTFQYAAQLVMREKFLFTKDNIFVIDITNIASKEWEQSSSDWIMAGCKVYEEKKSMILPLMELRQDLPRGIKKGERFRTVFKIGNGLLPKGKYKLKFDMVNEFQFWFEDLGSEPLIELVEF